VTAPRRLTADEVRLPLGDREVIVRKPGEKDIFVLTRLAEMLGGDATQDAIMLFGDVLEGLLPEQADRTHALRAILRGEIEVTDYAELASAAMRHFYADQAPSNGPVKATKRAARR
jgi:hypothetical protein